MARAAGRPVRRSAPLSRPERKPLPPPGSPHNSFSQCFTTFCLALGRECDLDDLAQHQQFVFYSLLGGPSEHAVAELYDWSKYNLDALRARGGSRRPVKPRVALIADVTSRKNLTVEWRPDGDDGETDWASWYRTPAYAGYRATNELLFVHNFGSLQTRPLASFASPFSPSVNEHLIATTAALIRDLAKRLEHTFEVRFVSELEVEWEPRPEKNWVLSGRHVLGWSIVNVKERTSREESDELEKHLHAIGHDGRGFVRLLGEAMPGVTLSDLQRESVIRKVRAGLLSHGVTLTPKPLGRLIELLDRYQPEVLAPLRQPETPPK